LEALPDGLIAAQTGRIIGLPDARTCRKFGLFCRPPGAEIAVSCVEKINKNNNLLLPPIRGCALAAGSAHNRPLKKPFDSPGATAIA
jgi:hypothetical protein